MTWTSHLPALQVIVPLLGAPLVALLGSLFPKGGAARIATPVITTITLMIACMIWYHVHHEGPFEYALGNWPAPIGITYNADMLSAPFLVLISLIACLSIITDRKDEEEGSRYALFLLALAGFLGIVITNDLFNTYVFIEIASLASYGLIALGKEKKALIAAFHYLIIGTIGATFFLIGIGLLYRFTGSLNLADITNLLNKQPSSTGRYAAFAFIATGLLIKMALFPWHGWLVRSYRFAPSFVAMFLSGIATKTFIYLFIRYLSTLLQTSALSFLLTSLLPIIGIFAALAVLFGTVGSIKSNDMRQMLAWSSIGHIGYIMLALSIDADTGITAALLQVFVHALTKSLLFALAGATLLLTGTTSLHQCKGALRGSPLLMTGLSVGLTSLAGVPLTAGFISKWYLLTSLADIHHFAWLALVGISSVGTLWYALRMIETLCSAKTIPIASATIPIVSAAKLPVGLGFSIALLSLLIVLIGIYPSPWITWLAQVVDQLHG